MNLSQIAPLMLSAFIQIQFYDPVSMWKEIDICTMQP